LSESRLESRSHSYDSLGPLERWSTGELEIPNHKDRGFRFFCFSSLTPDTRHLKP
jgi:hypothetical protein